MALPNSWDGNRFLVPLAELPSWFQPQPVAPLGLTPILSIFDVPPALVQRPSIAEHGGDGMGGSRPGQPSGAPPTFADAKRAAEISGYLSGWPASIVNSAIGRLNPALGFGLGLGRGIANAAAMSTINSAFGVPTSWSESLGQLLPDIVPGWLGIETPEQRFSALTNALYADDPLNFEKAKADMGAQTPAAPREAWPDATMDFYISQTLPPELDPGFQPTTSPNYPGNQYSGSGGAGPGVGGASTQSFDSEIGAFYHRGGYIPNRGSPRHDPVPIVAHEGEYVIRAPVAAELGQLLLDAINLGLIGRRELEALLDP